MKPKFAAPPLNIACLGFKLRAHVNFQDLKPVTFSDIHSYIFRQIRFVTMHSSLHVTAALLLACLASVSQAYFITVDAHAEECFFDKVKSGTKMGLMFEVAEGGFLDIDVRIVGPDGKTIHQVGFR